MNIEFVEEIGTEEDYGEVMEFVYRRFGKDCNWDTGNCYYLALILKDRFPEGRICYDVIYGHFVFEYEGKYYDWNGIYDEFDKIMVAWDEFDEYDELQKDRIIRDCIK